MNCMKAGVVGIFPCVWIGNAVVGTMLEPVFFGLALACICLMAWGLLTWTVLGIVGALGRAWRNE
jgi:hypothetical protein